MKLAWILKAAFNSENILIDIFLVWCRIFQKHGYINIFLYILYPKRTFI